MKKYSLGLLTVVFAVSSSFVVKTYAPLWRFTGNSANAADRVDQAKYISTSVTCSGLEVVLCAIEAPVDPNNSSLPQIMGSLQTALQNSGLEEPDFDRADIIGHEN
jgi:hypothetical protein